MAGNLKAATVLVRVRHLYMEDVLEILVDFGLVLQEYESEGME